MSNSAAIRHLSSSTVFDIGNHTGIVYTNPTEPAGAKFGFNGVIFRGNGGSLTVGNYTDGLGSEVVSKEILIIQGFTVDGITLNFNMPTNTSFKADYTHTMTVKNNGVLNWNTGVIPVGNIVNFSLESGSVLNAKFGDQRTVNVSKGSSFSSAKFNAEGKFSFSSFNFVGKFTVKPTDTGYVHLYGDSVISDQTVANQSYFHNKWMVAGNVTIDSSETGSIRMGSNYITMDAAASLILNSKNALTYKGDGQKAIALEWAGGSKAKVVLGADNEFRTIQTNSATSVATVVLNDNALSLAQIGGGYNFNGKLFFEDFKENLVKVDAIDSSIVGEGGLLSNIFAGSAADEANAKNLYWNSATGYLSLTAVPEPATYAAILGGLALAFAFMRRRR